MALFACMGARLLSSTGESVINSRSTQEKFGIPHLAVSREWEDSMLSQSVQNARLTPHCESIHQRISHQCDVSLSLQGCPLPRPPWPRFCCLYTQATDVAEVLAWHTLRLPPVILDRNRNASQHKTILQPEAQSLQHIRLPVARMVLYKPQVNCNICATHELCIHEHVTEDLIRSRHTSCCSTCVLDTSAISVQRICAAP